MPPSPPASLAGWKVTIVFLPSSCHRITSYNVCYTKLLRVYHGTLPRISDADKRLWRGGFGYCCRCFCRFNQSIKYLVINTSDFGLPTSDKKESMKYIIILGDGMSDEPLENYGGKTPLQIRITSYNVCYTKLLRDSSSHCRTIPEELCPG